MYLFKLVTQTNQTDFYLSNSDSLAKRIGKIGNLRAELFPDFRMQDNDSIIARQVIVALRYGFEYSRFRIGWIKAAHLRAIFIRYFHQNSQLNSTGHDLSKFI